jgi:hypothetical protein
MISSWIVQHPLPPCLGDRNNKGLDKRALANPATRSIPSLRHGLKLPKVRQSEVSTLRVGPGSTRISPVDLSLDRINELFLYDGGLTSQPQGRMCARTRLSGAG